MSLLQQYDLTLFYSLNNSVLVWPEVPEEIPLSHRVLRFAIIPKSQDFSERLLFLSFVIILFITFWRNIWDAVDALIYLFFPLICENETSD